MDNTARQILLKIAAESVADAVRGKKLPTLDSAGWPAELGEKRGCFVTIKTAGRLRGCLGHFISDIPLADQVNETARSSVENDPRFTFDRLSAGELDEVDIEISVLSELEKTDDPLSLRLGVDGIYIQRGLASGCFLPQVAEETGWSKEEFLAYCCVHKAGLSADAWKDPQTEVFLFTAEIFGDRLTKILEQGQ